MDNKVLIALVILLVLYSSKDTIAEHMKSLLGRKSNKDEN